ncbi:MULTISPECIES: hypothetical protein [unclassified Bradyrhizobium]|nr:MULTISPECIES: hypothetical protein [unclassified Bradyrhizobium]MCA1508645.1 hypothetical protein [Bradyrhizobium sp. NBAIM02]MCA1552383.1 hypothetical protein [Bradyrhizobium sp. BRP19]
MELVTVHFDDPALASSICIAVESAAPNASIHHFTGGLKPEAPPAAAGDFDPQLIERLVKIVQTVPKHIRLGLLYGDDSCSMSHGDARYSIRPETIALSRRLKPLFPHLASPIDALVVRRREYFFEGSYKGIRYIPTPLGVAVREALKAQEVA